MKTLSCLVILFYNTVRASWHQKIWHTFTYTESYSTQSFYFIWELSCNHVSSVLYVVKSILLLTIVRCCYIIRIYLFRLYITILLLLLLLLLFVSPFTLVLVGNLFWRFLLLLLSLQFWPLWFTNNFICVICIYTWYVCLHMYFGFIK